MRIAFAGTPEFALPTLAALRAEHEIVGVLTQPDRPSGRGRKLIPGAVKSAALAYGLPLAQPPALRSDAARAQLAAWQPQVLIVVAYGLLLPPEVLRLPPLGCVNIHASLLPRWRGAAPIERAILAGDEATGVSIMQMEAGLDTGPLLAQRRLAIRDDHTGGSLREELAVLGAAALLEALPGLAAGTLRATPQTDQGATYAPRIDKSEARIDWSGEAEHIARRVRAFNPWPVAETLLGGEQLRIFAAQAGSTVVNRQKHVQNSFDPGAIIGVHDGSMLVRCGRGYLAITRVQRPGRKPVSVRDFSHGVTLVGRKLG